MSFFLIIFELHLTSEIQLMRNLLFIFYFSLLFSVTAYSQQWIYTPKKPLSQIAWDGLELPNRNLIITGYTNGDSTNNSLAYLLKLSPDGNLLQEHSFSNQLGSSIQSVALLPNGNYVAVGYVKNSTDSVRRGYVACFNTAFEQLWEQRIVAPAHVDLEKVIVVNTTIVAAGNYIKKSSRDSIIICSFDFQGKALRRIGKQIPSFVGITDLAQVGNKEFLLAVHKFGGDTLLLMDTAFVVQQSARQKVPEAMLSGDRKLITNYEYDRVNGVKQTKNNSIYINSRISVDIHSIDTDTVLDKDYAGICLQKYMPQLDTVFTRSYVYEDVFMLAGGLDFIDENNIYIGGNYNFEGFDPYPDTLTNKYYVVKTDSMGAVKWQRLIGDTAYFFMSNVIATQDGGCVLLGSRYLGDGTQLHDIHVLKLDKDGTLQTSGISALTKAAPLQIYPNPTASVFTIALPDENAIEDFTVNVYSVTGQLLKSVDIANSNFTTIDIAEFTQGYYFVQLITESGKIFQGKIAKL